MRIVKRIIIVSIPLIFLFLAIVANINRIKDSIFRLFTPVIEFEYEDLKYWVLDDYGHSHEIMDQMSVREYDTRKIKKLSFYGWSSWDDLKYFPNLKKLSVTYADNGGIEKIGKCASLERLTLGGEFTDIKPLENLKNLKYLYIENNELEDFSAIGSLTNLEKLVIIGGRTDNLEFLSNLTNLKILYLSNLNNVTDLEPLVNLIKLEHIDLDRMENLRNTNSLSNFKDLVITIRRCPKVESIQN